MSADKHRSLARRVAWLRWFTSTNADGAYEPFSRVVNVKGYPHINADLERLEAEGHVVRTRSPYGWRSYHARVTCFASTDSGMKLLKTALARHGDTFGAHITQGDRPNKVQRAARNAAPETVWKQRRERKGAAVRRQAALLHYQHDLRASRLATANAIAL